ncbi:hypothetical protein KGA65_04295 [Ideonella sp. B7]|uniref:hypothetical protein n=1 Tax=Ideonella benzenivorans TaxID=2831643 RepID=UPI001CEDEF8D|nr:hypothetical protein [Ideonella benzenivorans]MCA6215761.1 hypothetical protein [Ideonella benzenivorans]
MKVGVIGNSHLASLKKGWEALAVANPSVALTFWGAPGNDLGTLARSGTALVSPSEQVRRMLAFTSGVGEEIQVPDHDVVLLYGLDLRIPFLPLDLSEQVRQQTCVDCLDASLNLRLAREIQGISGRIPIYIAPRPMGAFVAKHKLSTPHESYAEVVRRFQRIAAQVALKFQAQPQETLTYDWFTQEHFARNSVDLAGPDGADLAKVRHRVDHHHMNGDYGRLWLEGFLPQLR